MGTVAIWHFVYELRPLNVMNLQAHVIKRTNAHVYNMFLSHVCAFVDFVRGFVKTFKARIRNMDVLYSQSVCVYVSCVLYRDMMYELPKYRANRAISSSPLLTNRYPQPITVLVTPAPVTCD